MDGAEPDPAVAARNAFHVAEAVEGSGEYLDVHCHVWSRETFRECWATIATLELLPPDLAEITPPLPGMNEFTVSLIRR